MMKISNVFSKVHKQKKIEYTPEVSLSTAKLKEKAQQNSSDKLYRWRRASSYLHSLYSFCVLLEKKWQQNPLDITEDIEEFCQCYNLVVEVMKNLAQEDVQFTSDMLEKVSSTIKPACDEKEGGLVLISENIQPNYGMNIDVKGIWLGDKGVLKALGTTIYNEFLSPHSAWAYNMEKIGQKVKSLDATLDANYDIVKQRIAGSSNWQQGASAIYNQINNQRKWLDRQLTDLAEFYVGDTTKEITK
ncbi:hypothetical protein PRVXH_000517 [Proteinivorax hydrogeniformans]|uniref:Uncharacterized protein n=1 Tax=Proteinivorax hydrogeniformans TaxID=1826727 RepID=A0AAU8HUZ2_9FIRM